MIRAFYFIFLLLWSLQVEAINTDSLWAVINGNEEDSIKAKTYNKLGIAISNSDNDSAIKIYEAGIELAQRIQHKKTEAALLTNKGYSYYSKNDMAKCEKFITQAISVYNELGLNKNISYNYFILGTFRANRQEFKEAKILLEKAYEYGVDLQGNEDAMSRICNNLGLIYGYLEQRAQSVDFKIKAIKYKGAVNDPSVSASIMNLSLDYYNRNDYASAIGQLTKAYDMIKADTTVQKAICLQMLVQNYIALNDSVMAKSRLAELDNVATSLNDSTYFALATLERARLLTTTNRFQAANKVYEKAFSQLPENGTIRTKAQMHINYAMNLAKLFENGNNQDRSIVPRIIEQAQSALDLSTETGALKDQLLSLELLKDYSEVSGDYPAALKYSKEFIALNDSIFSKENELAAADLKYKYETENKELEIELLNRENELKAQEIEDSAIARKRQLYVIFGVLVVLLLAIALVGLLLRQSNSRKKTNAKLLEQNATIEEQKKQVENALLEITKRDEEKELLLKEIHHRVKNNLQVVSSLLDLQSKKAENVEKAALAEGQSRVRAMALIHEKLYESKTISEIDFEAYCKQLSQQIAQLYAHGQQVDCEIDVGSIKLDIDTAVPVGLILNELVTNAYKYAFANGAGRLRISAEKDEQNTYTLRIEDTGEGMPDDFDWRKSKSLGLRLVNRLARQLYGKAEYSNTEKSTFEITFKDTIERKKVA